MKKLFELGNRYAAKSTWIDFSLTKVCLCAMGILIGTFIPRKKIKPARIAAGASFGVTYTFLMEKVIRVLLEMRKNSE